MPYSRVSYTGNGATTVYAIPYDFIDDDHIQVYLDDALQDEADYTVAVGSLTFDTAPGNGVTIEIRRESSLAARIVDWTDGASVQEIPLDQDSKQAVYLCQELADDLAELLEMINDLDGDGVGTAPDDASYVVLGTNALLDNERVLTAGSGIEITDGGAGGALTIAATGGVVYTDEAAQDAVGGILTDSATIDFTYTDATPAITADVIDGSITAAKAAAALKDASYCGLIEEAEVKTYIIDLKVPVACTINELAGKTTSGTCTAKVQIDGVDVTGTSTAFSSTEASGTATAANSAAANTTISLVVTAASSPVDFAFTIKATVA